MATVASWSGIGLTDGAAVGTTTAGPGDTVFDTVTASAFTVDASGPHAPRIQVDQAGGVEAQLIWDDGTLGTLGAHAVRLYVDLSAWPGGNARLLAAHDAANALQWWLDVTSAGIVRLRNAGGSALDTSAAGLPTGTEMRFEVVGDGAGAVSVTIYVGDVLTPWDTLSGAGLGTTVQQLRVVTPSTSPTWPRLWVDEIAVSDTAAEIGPAPTAVARNAPRVELELGGTWTDVSTYVRYDDAVKITRGQKNEGRSSLDNATCDLTFNNTDGRFSPRHPTSPYYGLLGRNTPLRVSLPFGETYLRPGPDETDVITTPDDAALDITGDIDIRIEITSRGGGTLVDLCGKKESTGDQRSWNMWLTASRFMALTWTTAGTLATENTVFSTAALPTTSARLALRAALDVDNGAAGHTVTFYTADSIDGPWTQLGDAVVTSGVTSIFSGSAPVEVGCVADGSGSPVDGLVHAFQLRDGIDGTVVASPGFTTQTAGDTSFADAAGRTWTVQGAAVLDDRLYRFYGEVSEWPPKRDISGGDATVAIKAAGISRRLKQGKATLRSTMFREFSNPARANIIAYWPMEDGEEATQVASSNGTVPPAKVTGTPELGDYDAWTASDAVVTMGTGTISGTVPLTASTGEISVRAFVFALNGSVSAETSLLHVYTTGTAATWDVRITASGNLRTRAYDQGGTSLLDDTSVFTMFGRGFTILDLELTQDGADIDWRTIVLDFTNTDTIDTPIPTNVRSGTVAGQDVGVPRTVTVGRNQGLTDVKVGHLTVANDISAYLATSAAIAAHNGENPLDRMTRLCEEEEIPFAATSRGLTGNTVTMGDQLNKQLLQLLEEAADTDGGILYETRDAAGFGYRTRLSLYNQEAALTLSCAQHELNEALEPTDDDQRTVNDVTAERVAGSSVRVEQTTGRLSTADPPDGVGRYDTKVDLSLETDGQLADHAGWRLHLGTVDEARFPKVRVHLGHSAFTGDADLKAAALAVDVGDRLVITDPSPDLPPDDISQIVIGYSEAIDQFEHVITYVCAPESPWHVGQVETDGYDRIDTGGAVLSEDATTTGTELVVSTTTGAPWGNRGTPYDVLVAGERCTVTVIGDVLNTNPLFAAGITGWTGFQATIAHSTAVVHPDGAGSMQITPDGIAATGGGGSSLTGNGSITPGHTYEAMLWANVPGGGLPVTVLVNWHDAAAAFLSSSVGVPVTPAAGQWTHILETFTAPAGAAQATVWAWHSGASGVSDVWYAWAVRLVDVTRPLSDPFDRTETGGWGSAPSGAAWTPGIDPTRFSVDPAGGAQITLAAAGGFDDIALGLHCDATDVEVAFTSPAAAITGATVFVYLIGCYDQAADDWYALVIGLNTDASMSVFIEDKTGGVTSALTSSTTVPTATVDGVTTYRARLRVQGGLVRGKLWEDGAAEPGWQTRVFDDGHTAGNVGVQVFAPGTNSNTFPLTFAFSELIVHHPQALTVTRSVNGVVKALTAGAGVTVAEPVYVAL